MKRSALISPSGLALTNRGDFLSTPPFRAEWPPLYSEFLPALRQIAQNHKVVSNSPSSRCSLPPSVGVPIISDSSQRSGKGVPAMIEGRAPYEEAVLDFDADFDRLMRASLDRDEQRRAWLAMVGHIFRLREYRMEQCDDDAAYDAIVAANESGQVTEGIIVIRSIATHALTVRANPESRILCPGSKVFPSDYLFPGDGNLFWRDMGELSSEAADAVRARDRRRHYYYRDKVAGLLVPGTLQAAREFLTKDDLFT